VTGRPSARQALYSYVDSAGVGHLAIDDAASVRGSIAGFEATAFESVVARERARYRILAAASRYDIAVDPDDTIRQPTSGADG
jgi:hypothetical protein